MLPERHLGLVQAREHSDLPARLDGLATMAEQHLDLDGILAMARPLGGIYAPSQTTLKPPGQRIALASDEAGEGRHAIMRGQRGADDADRDCCATAFAQAHVEGKQRFELEAFEQTAMSRLGRAMAGEAMFR